MREDRCEGLAREVDDARRLSDTIVGGEAAQSPGLLRNIQSVFEAEFGPKWLEKELQK